MNTVTMMPAASELSTLPAPDPLTALPLELSESVTDGAIIGAAGDARTAVVPDAGAGRGWAPRSAESRAWTMAGNVD